VVGIVYRDGQEQDTNGPAQLSCDRGLEAGAARLGPDHRYGIKHVRAATVEPNEQVALGVALATAGR